MEYEFGKNDFNNHIKCLKEHSKQSHFMVGGFENKLGGIIIFEAKDIKKTEKVVDCNSIINDNLYEWNVILKH